MLVIVLFAAIVYGLFWLVERRGKRKRARTQVQKRTPPKRTLGPDDDEAFLRELEQRRRRAAREKQNKKLPEDEGKSEKDQSRPD